MNHQSQWKARRLIAGTSTARNRQVETRFDSASSVPARSPVGFSKAFYARAGVVFASPSRRREMAVAHLSSQSALWRAEPISLFHGKHAPAAQSQRLRILS